MKNIVLSAFAVALALAMSQVTQAQSLSSATLDGGGGTSSSSGSFSVTGTIGQVDAGYQLDMSGSTIQLEGGFWQSQNSAVPVELMMFEIASTSQKWRSWVASGGLCSWIGT